MLRYTDQGEPLCEGWHKRTFTGCAETASWAVVTPARTETYTCARHLSTFVQQWTYDAWDSGEPPTVTVRMTTDGDRLRR